MKHTAFGPKQSPAFRDNYVAAFLIVAALFLSNNITAQTAPSRDGLNTVNTIGNNNRNGAYRGVLYIPMDTIATADSGAVAFLNSTLYQKNSDYWVPVGKATRLNDSTIVVGNDTLVIQGAGTTVTNALGSGDTLLTADGTIKRIRHDATLTASTNGNAILLGADTISYVSTPAKLRDTAAALRAAMLNKIGIINSQPLSDKGAVKDGDSLNFQFATSGYPGLVSADTQTIAGAKTFTDVRTNFKGYNPQLNVDYMPTDIVADSIVNGLYNSFGMIDVFPSGKYVMAYREGTSHVGDVGLMVMRTSVDQGKTWSEPDTVVSDAEYDIKAAYGGVTKSGRLIIFYGRYNADPDFGIDMKVIYSDDEGVTWSTPVDIPESGSWYRFVPYGHLVNISADTVALSFWASNENVDNASCYIVHSYDGGITWQEPVEVIHIDGAGGLAYVEPAFVATGGGSIVGLIRSYRGQYFRQVKSEDNGMTWTDQGYTNFDTCATSWTAPAYLKLIETPSGRRAIAAYYTDRTEGYVRSVYGYVEDVLASSTGWDNESRTNLGVTGVQTTSGYVAVAHPFNKPGGLGWYYVDSALEKTNIVFFSTPKEIPLKTNFRTVNASNKVVISSTALGLLTVQRNTTATDNVVRTIETTLASSNNMVNGFGPLHYFNIRDNAGTTNSIAAIGAVRSGADNTGSLVFRTSNSGTFAEHARITNDGRLGMGTEIPQFPIHVITNGTTGIASQNSATLSATSGGFVRLYNTGTPSASGQRLGSLLFGAATGSSVFRGAANIEVYADQAWSGAESFPAYMVFRTTPVGSNVSAERARITANGCFNLNNTTNTSYRLYVGGSVAVNKDSVPLLTTTAPDYMLTQDTTTGQISRRLLPKKYVANIAQTGTSDPTAAVLGDNTIGSIVWTRNSAGNYTGTLSGAFTVNKTWLSAHSSALGKVTASLSRVDADTVTLIVYGEDSGAVVPEDDFDSVSIEIRVYP